MLCLSHITKQYQGYKVLDDVGLTIRAGEIHGLVGVNGSGKTTLLNILSGQAVIRRTGGFSGSFRLDGRECRFSRPDQAIAAGIAMVHQEFALVPCLSAGENISLSREAMVPWTRPLGSLGLVDRRANCRHASSLLSGLGQAFDPETLARDLPVGVKQFVEMARELNRPGLRLLLLDEPTAVLGRDDAGLVIRVIRDLARRGTAVLYVSHRLEEVAACCHKITVLRNGKQVACLENHGLGRSDSSGPARPGHEPAQARAGQQDLIQKLSGLMVGGTVQKTMGRGRQAPVRSGKPLVCLRRFFADKPGDRVDGLDLDLYEGEILGITSLAGHGRTGLAAGIFGACPARGKVWVRGRRLTRFSPRSALAEGLWHLPEERAAQGILPRHSVTDNMTFAPVQTQRDFVFPILRTRAGSWGFVRDHRRCRAYAGKSRKRLGIQCRSLSQPAGELSGGNQQKVCLAHALAMRPDLLFVTDPTRGIDIQAKEAILQHLVSAGRSMTLVVSSGELNELHRICDRILVLYQGRLFAVLGPDRSERDLGLACSGIRPEKTKESR